MKSILIGLLTVSSLTAFAGNSDVGSVGVGSKQLFSGKGNTTEFGEQTCNLSIKDIGGSQQIIDVQALGLEYSILGQNADAETSTIKSTTESSSKDSKVGKSSVKIETSITLKNGKPNLMTVKMIGSSDGMANSDSVKCTFF